MKKQIIKTLILFVFASTLFTSCSSSDSSSPATGDNTLLFGKWWYDVDNYTADIYFHADGQYDQTLTVMGTTLQSPGDWTWIDQPNKIMKVVYDAGTNGVSQVYYKFTDIQAHSFAVKISLDNGATYSDTTYHYADTDSN